MQINIRAAAAGGGAYITIADTVNGDLIDFKPPTLATLEQIEPLCGGGARFVANRGNAVWTILIPITQFAANYTAARQQIATLGATLASGGLFDLQILDISPGDATYMPACSLGDFSPDQTGGNSGIAIKYTLKFTGPQFTTTAP